MRATLRFDGVLVGGGLQSALIALAVLRRDPQAKLAIVEQASKWGGNHTWSFHAQDVSAAMAEVVAPLVVERWPGYEVAFPGLVRSFDQPYSTISSERLAEVLEAKFSSAPNARLFKGSAATAIGPGHVELASGERLEASVIVDARGPERSAGESAYQKFVGLELKLEGAPELTRPCIMDARVEQLDGFRFVYTLPLAPDRWLVEDTYYSDSPQLDEAALTERVLQYTRDRGARVRRVLRTERGVLPLPLTFEPLSRADSPLVAGYRGGWFHPTTGYSLPCAARLAEALGASWPALPPQLEALRAQQETQARYFTLLNRLLFRACAPADRWGVLERFHRLPEATVARFYALQTSRMDRARIVLGRPPRGVSLGRALAEFANAAR